MSAVKEYVPGEMARAKDRTRQNDQAKYARLKRAENEWLERQTIAVRGQQQAMRAEFYDRHPELRP